MKEGTTQSLALLLGQTFLVRFDKLRVRVTVLDAKVSYGRVRVQVSPTDGVGSAWIEAERLEDNREP